MKSLKRTQFGNPILRKKARRLTLREIKKPSFKRLIQDMFFTIEEIGVGLAAPQIGKSIQLAVINVHPFPHQPNIDSFVGVIINPKILTYSKKEEGDYEGCLSFDELRAEAYRSTRIQVEYWDEEGVKHTEWFEGFLARVFQHEIDHLNGNLFIDRVKDTRTVMTIREFTKRVR